MGEAVAIVAVSMTGLVGVLGPTITGLFSKAHQRNELDHRAAQEQLQARRQVLLAAIERMTAAEEILRSGVINEQDGQQVITSRTGNTHNIIEGIEGQQNVLFAWFNEEDGLAKAYALWSQRIFEAINEKMATGGVGEARTLATLAGRQSFFAHARPHLRMPTTNK